MGFDFLEFFKESLSGPFPKVTPAGLVARVVGGAGGVAVQGRSQP
jgi:hypothetical protein